MTLVVGRGLCGAHGDIQGTPYRWAVVSMVLRKGAWAKPGLCPLPGVSPSWLLPQTPGGPGALGCPWALSWEM